MSALGAKERERHTPLRQRSSLSGIIVTAGSRGGVSALKILLSSLPKGFPHPIVVVQHRTAKPPFVVPEILRSVTPLSVKFAEDLDRLQPGTVYIVPPDLHARIERGQRLRLFDGERINFVLSSANPLFQSAAREIGAGVIAVVLSGSGTNGAEGVRAVKAAGGTVIVQDRASAEAWGMPKSAVGTGAVDYIVPVRAIGPLLVTLTHDPRDN